VDLQSPQATQEPAARAQHGTLLCTNMAKAPGTPQPGRGGGKGTPGCWATAMSSTQQQDPVLTSTQLEDTHTPPLKPVFYLLDCTTLLRTVVNTAAFIAWQTQAQLSGAASKFRKIYTSTNTEVMKLLL